MAKKLGTQTNDSEGLVADFTIEKGSTPSLAFKGEINPKTISACEKRNPRGRKRRAECESFLEVLNAFYEALHESRKPEPCPWDEDQCNLIIEFHVNGQVARLETPIKAWHE